MAGPKVLVVEDNPLNAKLLRDVLTAKGYELLEKLDGIITGSVTILDKSIEIDAKLLSRADSRIIAATQRGGQVKCLRQIVERLGIALENEFLRPYDGKLKITLRQPEYVHLSLTPVLSEDALGLEEWERNQTGLTNLESDDPSEFLELVLELRSAEQRPYTERDVPIFTCLLQPIREVLDGLGG